MIVQNKKILLVGPSGAGKTTIKKVYFDRQAPLELLQNPLGPSRGASSSIYSYINSNLGVFDLAGQENAQWLSDKGLEIFSKASAILCIFDIKNSLESIIKFLIKIYKVKKDLNLESCQIVAFLHKIDRSNPSYVSFKISSLKKFITRQHALKDNIKIFETSISKDYFYNTFSVISDILNNLFKKGKTTKNKEKFNQIKESFSKIIGNEIFNDLEFGLTDEELKYDNNDIGLDLGCMEDIGLVKQINNTQYFQLTERALYLRIGWNNEKENNTDKKLKSKIDNFHILLLLNKNES